MSPCLTCEDGIVWIRIDIDDELPAPCPDCQGTGEQLDEHDFERAA